ncbi:MAG: DUF222 domain-containing protein [Streptosporangiaceae bacterium]
MSAPGQHSAPAPGQHSAPAPGQYRGPAAPRSMRQALAALHDALSYLASADPTALTAVEQARCLRSLRRAESVRLAAQSSVLGAFEANGGYADDGHGSARSWLRWQARMTGPAASAAVAWTRRLAAHPAIRDALAAGEVSESWAMQLCDWTDLLPVSARNDADTILLAAAAAGASLHDLAGLAEEMRARTAAPDADGDRPPDRSVRLDLHYRGAGRLRGDLTPRCAAALQAVLDALGNKQGPDDLRTRPQRDHDALEEACRRLVAAGMLPGRAGQPTKILLHMNLTDLLNAQAGQHGEPAGPDRGAGQPHGTGQPQHGTGHPQRGGPGELARSELARRRLFPDREDLTGPWPGGYAGPGPMAGPGDRCDASIVPVVTGNVDHALLARLAAALVSGDPAALGVEPRPSGPAGPVSPTGPVSPARSGRPGAQTAGHPGSASDALADQYARELVLRGAVALLSGPEGLAARLRTGSLTGPAGSISLPLDVGTSTDTVPPHLRRAVWLRDRHCAFPGCENRICQVHHIIPRSEGGPTRLDNLVLGCSFHHLIAIHQWGWRLVLNADGTTTAIGPDGHRVLHSHGPPRAA